MGGCTSFPTKEVEFAISNKNAPLLFKKYKINDHLFDYGNNNDKNLKNLKNYNLNENNNDLSLNLNLNLLEEVNNNNNNEHNLKKLNINEKEVSNEEIYSNEENENFLKLNSDIEDFSILFDYHKKGEKRDKKHILKEEKLYNSLKSGNYSKRVAVSITPTDKHIYCCRNYITHLTSGISQLKHVKILQLCCNYISIIPKDIKFLINLQVLILSKNRIKVLPYEIGYCRDLKELDVSFNKLTTLPKSIIGLKNLNILHLNNNEFEELPDVIGNLNRLKTLHIHENKLKSVPFNILKLPFLDFLNYEGNLFKSKQEPIFREIGKLSLMEETAREIIRKCFPIKKSLPVTLKEFLLEANECSFCKGPFINNYFEIFDYHEHEGVMIPISYKMCSPHYKIHQERLEALFSFKNITGPIGISKYELSSVIELFQPPCVNSLNNEILNNKIEIDPKKIPLTYLSVLNSEIYKNMIKRNTEEYTNYEDLDDYFQNNKK